MSGAPGGPDLVVVRHGETEWSRTGQHTGRTDIPLTEDGRAVATGLGARLASWSFSLVLTSPLSRARDTATLAGFGDAAVDDDLLEWDYGSVEGVTTATFREQVPGWTVWRDGCPGGESVSDVGVRADRVISRARAADGPVLAFAHGHLLRILAARWLGLEAAWGRAFVLDPATLSILGWERETPALRRWNDHVD